ncbi:MAG: phosphatidylserine decarboxylase [Armatimonadota bacterium]|nr:phosphatidylserine decarboxylase [Armatimonadota bacterium]
MFYVSSAIWAIILLAAVFLFGLWFLRNVWFYRDPERKPDSVTPGSVVAPADGRVVYIKRIERGTLSCEKLGQTIPLPEITGNAPPDVDGFSIGIYMSPLDVHFNYCPHPGVVEQICYTPAKVNLPMLDMWEYIKVVWLRKMVNLFGRRYHLENERNTIFLDCGGIKMAVVLIADKFVSKIKCFVREGQSLGYSEKLGFIDRGSQVDLVILSPNVEFLVDVNQQVYGGKTVIALLRNPAHDGGVCPHTATREYECDNKED